MTNDLLRRIGQRVRELREQRGMSQEAFADFVGVHRTYMGHVETGRKDFRLTSIQRIVDTLGISLADFFEGIETGEPAKARRTGGQSLDRDRIRAEVAALERTVGALKTLVDPGGEAAVSAKKSTTRKTSSTRKAREL